MSSLIEWENGEVIDGALSKCQGFVIYDPINSLDRKHALRYNNLTHLKIPGVGHGIPVHLQEMGMLKWVVVCFISNTLNISTFYEKARKRRTISRYYKWLLGKENKHLRILCVHL